MNNAKKKIFRQSALDKLSNPDQLDSLVKVTSPTGWLALAGCGVVICAAVLWGVFGQLPTKVVGSGILIKTGGIKEVTFSSQGRISDISVSTGDIIRQGQLIGRVEQPQLLSELGALRLRREEALAAMAVSRDVSALERERLRRQIQATQVRIKSRTELVDAGLITKSALNADENSLRQFQIQFENLAIEASREASSLSELNQKIKLTSDRLDQSSRVYSNFSGRVVEIRASVGQLVGPGTTFVTVEPMGLDVKDLEAILYVPAGSGKAIEAGMTVQVSPATVKREEYGSMLGVVTSVGKFPATYNGMMTLLRNEELVRGLSQSGATLQVAVDFKATDNNFSGYEWTSPSGPPVTIEAGTICSGQVVTRSQPPIALVIPAVKKWLGLY